jgi:hypothetical protein
MTDIRYIQWLLFVLYRLYEGHFQILLDHFCPSQWRFFKKYLLGFPKILSIYGAVPPE